MSKRSLDVADVLDWDKRSRRAHTKKPLTYWEEFVENDSWYVDKLLEDVPDEELKAACCDSDFSDSEETEAHQSEESDGAYEHCSTEEELSDTDSEEEEDDASSEDGSEHDSELDESGGSSDEEEACIQRPAEGERGGEGAHGEGEGGSMGEARAHSKFSGYC